MTDMNNIVLTQDTSKFVESVLHYSFRKRERKAEGAMFPGMR